MNYVCDFSRNVSKRKREILIYTQKPNRQNSKAMAKRIENTGKEKLSVAIATAGQYQSIELLTESLNEVLYRFSTQRNGFILCIVNTTNARHPIQNADYLWLLDVSRTHFQNQHNPSYNFNYAVRLRSIRPEETMLKSQSNEWLLMVESDTLAQLVKVQCMDS